MQNKINFYRKQKGLTLKQLADSLGYKNYQMVQQFEKGQHVPSVDIALKLARALDVTVEELFILDD
ncbi:MAG: helix-turn-helix domain-containing protein [Clostridia bacterium]|nr:helix-turn-helix domain-containing protein [Clostridia bacterium]